MVLTLDLPLRTETLPPPPLATVDLAAYHLILLNSSGGKDSQTMLHVMVEAAQRQGVLTRLAVVHAKMDVEWPGTPEIVQAQADQYGLPVYYVERAQPLLDQVRQRGMWPSSTARYCTSSNNP